MKNGFTIIEVIIAILVLSIGVMGVLSAFYVIVFLSQNSVDRFIATYLAQEGIEIVRNIRDTNWLTSNEWNNFILTSDQQAPGGSNDWQADYTTTGSVLLPCPGCSALDEAGRQATDYLCLHSDKFYYTTEDSPETNCPEGYKFKRIITVYYLEDSAVKVTSEVFWDQKQRNINLLEPPVKIIEVLYDWY